MQTFTTVIAASTFLAIASGSPIQVRSTCGSTPSGSGSQQPLSQPTGITTAAACQAQCEANASCESFVFGMVNNVDKCMLYAVAATSVPKQPSTNLVVYDKACSSVPAVVPTASNPTGSNGHKLAVRDTCGLAPSGSGSQTPLAQPTDITTASACQSQCEANASCLSFVFGMANNVDECILYSVVAASVPSQSSANLIVYDKACTSVPDVVPTTSNPTGAATGSSASSSTGSNTGSNQSGSNGTPKLAVRDTCGAVPTGPTGNASPISTPSNIDSADACKVQCEADASCKSFEYGTMTSGASPTCRLFSVAASSVPAPTSGQSFVVYDVGCPM